MFNPITLLRRRLRPARPTALRWLGVFGAGLALAAGLTLGAPAAQAANKTHARPAAQSKAKPTAPARAAPRSTAPRNNGGRTATSGRAATGRGTAKAQRGRHALRRAAPAAAAAGVGAAALAAAPGEMPRFARPVGGQVVQSFDGERNKGVDLAASPGEPVTAAADGRVAFVGSELAGYGHTVIIEHGRMLISAYSHVRNVRVREQQRVRQGEVIAEVEDGNAGGADSRLHFEIRREGVAVDPQPYLAP